MLVCVCVCAGMQLHEAVEQDMSRVFSHCPRTGFGIKTTVVLLNTYMQFDIQTSPRAVDEFSMFITARSGFFDAPIGAHGLSYLTPIRLPDQQ